MANLTSKSNTQKLIGSISSLLCIGTVVAPSICLAATPLQTPTLIAQEVNGRVATLQCGGYTITIRFVGTAASKTFSYQTRGLFLRNGSQDGDDYVFYNSDYEYRVTTEGGGSGRLQVFHYGEQVLDKQCTWS
jgi:hypothetical protein